MLKVQNATGTAEPGTKQTEAEAGKGAFGIRFTPLESCLNIRWHTHALPQ